MSPHCLLGSLSISLGNCLSYVGMLSKARLPVPVFSEHAEQVKVAVRLIERLDDSLVFSGQQNGSVPRLKSTHTFVFQHFRGDLSSDSCRCDKHHANQHIAGNPQALGEKFKGGPSGVVPTNATYRTTATRTCPTDQHPRVLCGNTPALTRGI